VTTIEKIHWLTDKKEGMGIPIAVIARYARCHPTTIGNYLRGNSTPTLRLEQEMNEAIDKILEAFNKIKEN